MLPLKNLARKGLKKNKDRFILSTVTADGRAPLDAGTSADTVITKSASCI